MNKEVYDQASEVTAEDGDVQMDGPDGVAVSLTPEAALETSERLTEGATVAAGQRHWKAVDAKAREQRLSKTR